VTTSRGEFVIPYEAKKTTVPFGRNF